MTYNFKPETALLLISLDIESYIVKNNSSLA